MPYPVPTLFQPFGGTLNHHSPISAILDHLDLLWYLLGTQFGHLLDCKGSLSGQSRLHIPCSNLIPPWSTHFKWVVFGGTMDHQSPLSAILDHLDPVLDLLGIQFGHLLGCKGVVVVSPDCPYPVPTLFHLDAHIWGHLGPSEPHKCYFGPFGPHLGPQGDPIWTFIGL